MTINPDWDDLLRAEREYYSARDRFLSCDPIPALRTALAQGFTTPPDRDSALRVITDFGAARPDVVTALVPELFEYALDMSFRGDRIRTVLSRLETRTLQDLLSPLVGTFISDQSREAADYWGLIALLVKVRLRELCSLVLDAALSSSDIEVAGVARQWLQSEVKTIWPDIAEGKQ